MIGTDLMEAFNATNHFLHLWRTMHMVKTQGVMTIDVQLKWMTKPGETKWIKENEKMEIDKNQQKEEETDKSIQISVQFVLLHTT